MLLELELEFRQNFLPSGHLCSVVNSNFTNYLSIQKMAAISIFKFFAKIAKCKKACILKTMRDREILTKFLTHRVSVQSSQPNFQTNFVFPKMAASLNFRIFRKNCKTQKCLYLENCAKIEGLSNRQNF